MGDDAAARQDAKDGLADYRLSRAGFADERHGGLRAHAERDTRDRADEAARRREADMEVADSEKIGQTGSPAAPGTLGAACD